MYNHPQTGNYSAAQFWIQSVAPIKHDIFSCDVVTQQWVIGDQ
jgi:hypothetical protein